MQRKKREIKVTFNKIEELVRLKKNGQLKLIIQQANSSDLTGNDGTTLLHLAAKHNNVNLIKYLTENGYNLNVKNVFGETPLLTAASYNSSEALNVLLDVGADIFLRVVENKSTLQVIVDKTREISAKIIVDVLKHLRKKFIDAQRTGDVLITAQCPLEFVLWMRDAEVTKIMLNSREYLTPKEFDRIMECAIKTGYLENVRVLLEFGKGDYASMTAYVENLCNIIDAPNANLRSAKLYIQQIDNWNLYEHFWLNVGLIHVFEEKSKKIVRFFLHYGVDEHVRNRYDFDLIAHLFANVNFEASEVLNDRDFNVNAFNIHKISGLCVSAAVGSRKNIKFLLERGADVNLTNDLGLTSMHYVRLAHCVLPLLRYGAHVQIIGTKGQTVFDQVNDSSSIKLAHLAMIEAKGVWVKQQIRAKIDADSEMNCLFEQYSLQLEWMRDIEIGRNVTLFTCLIEKPEKFSHCIRSQECANFILHRCRVSGIHEYYYLILKSKLKRAAKIYDLRWKAAKIISEFMGIYHGHVVIKTIINFLSLDDLRAFDSDDESL